MENDSLNVNDSAALSSNVIASGAKQSLDADSSVISAPEIELPSPEQLGISIVSGLEGGMPAVTVGDTFDFPVTVSWSVQGSALLVVPTGSANAKGLTQVGMSQESARSVKDGKEIASITFTYKIVAEDTGALNVPAMRFEIPTQVGRPLDLRSESVAVRVNEPFNPLPIAVGLVVAVCVLLAGLWRAKRRASTRAAVAARNAAQEALREKMLVLKQRVNSADSREWLLELESICKEYVAGKFPELAEGTAGKSAGYAPAEKDSAGKVPEPVEGPAAKKVSAASAVNLDAMVKESKLEGWEALVEEFAHARYGGGNAMASKTRKPGKRP